MKRLIISSILLFFIAASGFSYTVNIYARNNAKEQIGEVIINNEIVMRLYDTIDKEDPYVRADKIVQRINQIIALGINPMEIKVKYTGNYYHAFLGNNDIFTVGKKEAQVNQTTEDILAIEWIEKIRRILKGMPISDVKLKTENLVETNRQPTPVISESPAPETGIAAWFDGENNDFVAVHPSLPVGTKIRVKNVSNGWSIVVKIIGNKNLPLGRIINVSKSAAQALGILQKGFGKVTVTAVIN